MGFTHHTQQHFNQRDNAVVVAPGQAGGTGWHPRFFSKDNVSDVGDPKAVKTERELL